MTRARALAALALVAVAVVVIVVLRSGGEHATRIPTPTPVAPVLPRRVVPLRPPFAAQVVRRTQLRTSPRGRVIATLGRRTGFGSLRVLAVVRRHGPWLAVLAPERGNSRAGWIPKASALLLHVPYTVTVDLSQRRLEVRHEGRVVRDVRVAIGAPGTQTPAGRFAVTDLLRTTGGGSPYGCCAVALTARQPHIAQGWGGGDRIAIHGTPSTGSIGTAASHGCLRAGRRDMLWMLRHLPLGTRVTVRA